ncbi:MAG: hypothetical protein CSA03_03090 [Bacteroidetes bacterium]|nr:MAG: hypothetical protein CSA03_03090 [Bacteroidota bacterium]
MSDLLKYRLPKGEVVEKLGAFVPVQLNELTKGFVVANADKSKVFAFEEGERAIEKTSFTEPNCYAKEEYLEKADTFIAAIQSKGLSKAIFSRVKSHTSDKSGEQLFKALIDAYPAAFVYLISSEHFGTWIGATPEKLIRTTDEQAETVSLAGTMKANDSQSWGEKERFEQQFVSDFIEEQLREIGIKNLTINGPHDRVAGPVKHLETQFQFDLNQISPIQIADKLHPTPAVSGLPQKEALNLIASIETHDRSLYTGFIGVVGEETDLFVNLRCAQIIGNEFFLYLGGGFTKDSIAEKEWEETENKSRTLLNILENS